VKLEDKLALNFMFPSPSNIFLLFSEESIFIDQEETGEIRSDGETEGAIRFLNLDCPLIDSLTISAICS